MVDKKLHRKLKIEHNELECLQISILVTFYDTFVREKMFVTVFSFFYFSDIWISWSRGLIIFSSIRNISSIRISYDGPREGASKTFRTESIKWNTEFLIEKKNIIINVSYLFNLCCLIIHVAMQSTWSYCLIYRNTILLHYRGLLLKRKFLDQGFSLV